MVDADLLASFARPVLVVAGDRDEYVPVEPLHELLDPLEGAELVVLEGVDHFFMAGLGDLGRCVREWLDGGR
jgi:pimeloyl-ACP methyl ester carboxylesterase